MSELTHDEIKKFIIEKNGVIPNANLWPEPVIDSDQPTYKGDMMAGLEGPAFDYLRSLSSSHRFPVSSVFMAAMGAIGCMTARCMLIQPYRFGGTRPLNFYAIVAAGSGEGKSTILKGLFKPFEEVTDKIERKKTDKRIDIEFQIAQLNESMKAVKAANKGSPPMDIPEYKSMYEEYKELKDELRDYQPVVWNMASFNLQEAAISSEKQGGYIPVYAAENEPIDFIAGTGGLETPLFRYAYDGERFTYGKQGLQVLIKNPVAGVCVLGQAFIIDRLLDASKVFIHGDSNGLIERFCMIHSEKMVGRKALIKQGEPPTEIQKRAWKSICENMCTLKPKQVLRFSEKAIKFMDDVHLKYDEKCADGEIFSMPPILGFVSKSTGHIANIAGILHVMKEYTSERTELGSADKYLNISDETVHQAARVFKEIVTSHLSIYRAKGILGVDARSKEVMESLISLAGRKRKIVFTSSEVQQYSGGKSCFRKGKKLTSKELFDEIYPNLEQSGILVCVGKKVYLNPKIS